jgi:hypothetical protein
MNNTIDIEVAIDTESLLNDFQNPSMDFGNVTGLPHEGYAYMIATTAHVNGGQATGDLSINGIVNDVIRWRCLSLSGNSDQSAVVYNVPMFGGSQLTGPINAIVAQPFAPVPVLQGEEQTAPPSFNGVVENDYYLEATITGHGTENYMFQFYVTENDPSTGEPVLKGCFGWDPTITVN